MNALDNAIAESFFGILKNELIYHEDYKTRSQARQSIFGPIRVAPLFLSRVFWMRHKGRITEWQDNRGFGFITPVSGGDRIFVHIKSFTNRYRRPIGNELVIYELKSDPKGRLQAANVTFSGDRSLRTSAPGPATKALIFTVTFLVFISVAVITDVLPVFVFLLYVLASAITYFAYAWDKSSARNNRWRTPEGTLLLFGLAGGWPGALVAQKTLRHKSNKQSFQIVFWLTVGLNCSGLIWLLMNPEGSWRRWLTFGQ